MKDWKLIVLGYINIAEQHVGQARACTQGVTGRCETRRDVRGGDCGRIGGLESGKVTVEEIVSAGALNLRCRHPGVDHLESELHLVFAACPGVVIAERDVLIG
jgi:hypothetical protein